MARIFRYFVTLIILALLIASITFGVLFYVKNTEYMDATKRNESTSSELALAKQKITELETTCTGECPTMMEFVDKEQDIEFNYPVSWKLEVSTKIGELAETGIGRLLTGYQIILTKGNAQLTYDRVLVATGFTPQPAASGDEFKVINDEVARLKRSGNPDWVYVSYDDCPEEMTAEYCYASATPGFGEGSKVVTLKGASDAAIVKEADDIVLSAQ